VAEQIKAYLVLGCNGHSGQDGFVDCDGVSNPIIDLVELEESRYERVLYFFENACDLFEKPMYNYNKVSNALNMLHRDYSALAPSMLFNVQHFLRMHKKCGPYLILIMKEDYDNE
jgi:hypothetical protein